MSRNYRRSRPKASRVFDQRFDLFGATALGGLNELGRFLLKLEIEKRLAARFRDAKSRWSSWRLDRVIGILLDAYFAGIERLYHFEDLETEPLLCARHGVGRLPDLNTLYRDLRPVGRLEFPPRRRAGHPPTLRFRRRPGGGGWFTAEYKLRILREVERCKAPGEVGAILRREGLYSSLLTEWRRQRDRIAKVGLAATKRGPKARAVDPRMKQLERENAKLRRRLQRTELMLLLVLYRDRGLRLKTRFRIATLRRRFIAIAGRLVHHAGQIVLRLSPHTPLRAIALARPLRA